MGAIHHPIKALDLMPTGILAATVDAFGDKIDEPVVAAGGLIDVVGLYVDSMGALAMVLAAAVRTATELDADDGSFQPVSIGASTGNDPLTVASPGGVGTLMGV